MFKILSSGTWQLSKGIFQNSERYIRISHGKIHDTIILFYHFLLFFCWSLYWEFFKIRCEYSCVTRNSHRTLRQNPLSLPGKSTVSLSQGVEYVSLPLWIWLCNLFWPMASGQKGQHASAGLGFHRIIYFCLQFHASASAMKKVPQRHLMSLHSVPKNEYAGSKSVCNPYQKYMSSWTQLEAGLPSWAQPLLAEPQLERRHMSAKK